MKIRKSEINAYRENTLSAARETQREALERGLKAGKITWVEFKRKMNI